MQVTAQRAANKIHNPIAEPVIDRRPIRNTGKGSVRHRSKTTARADENPTPSTAMQPNPVSNRKKAPATTKQNRASTEGRIDMILS